MISFAQPGDRDLFQNTLAFAARQVKRLVETYPDFFPMYTHHGRWKHDLPAWTHWCDGFLPGILWIQHTHQTPGSAEAEWWKRQAIHYSKQLEHRQFDRDVHDLGFIFFSTYLRWYQLTRQPELKDVIVQAGKTMALRFQEKGQYLCSFVSADSLFIDIMMNVGIIFYAAQATGDAALWRTACRHALTSRRVLVRGDGSTAHEGLFDLQTGEFLRQTTHQGYRGDSCCPAGWPGASMVSAPASASARTRGFWKPPSAARTSTLPTPHPMASRLGTMMPLRKAAARWTPPRLPSPLPA